MMYVPRIYVVDFVDIVYIFWVFYTVSKKIYKGPRGTRDTPYVCEFMLSCLKTHQERNKNGIVMKYGIIRYNKKSV